MNSASSFYLYIALILFFSCQGSREKPSNEDTNQFFLFCPKEEYKVNQLTGKKIEQSNGSIVGQWQNIKSRIRKSKIVYHDLQAAFPRRGHLVTQEQHNIPLNHPLFFDTTISRLDFTAKETHQLANHQGKLIQTGKWHNVRPHAEPARWSLPVKTTTPKIRDDARFDIQRLDVFEGLSSSYVYDVLEDRRGCFWFATHNGGLSCYNGQEVVHYRTEQGLPHNRVNAIIEDHQGFLWLATEGGLCKYDGKRFFHYTTREGLISDDILCIKEDSQFRIWFGTGGGGLGCIENEKIIFYTQNEGLGGNVIRSIEEDSEGSIWVANEGGGLARLQKGTITSFTFKLGELYNRLLVLFKDVHDNLWFGTEGAGIVCYRSGRFMTVAPQSILSRSIIWDIQQDQAGCIWVGTADKGLVKMTIGEDLVNQPVQISIFNASEGLTCPVVRSICVDDFGDLWLGTDGGGVNRCVLKGMQFYTAKEGLSNQIVRGIIQGVGAQIWMGTDGGGLLELQRDNVYSYGKEQGLLDSAIYALEHDNQERLWVGTAQKGIFIKENNVWRLLNTSNGLSRDIVSCLKKDSKGRMWIGTYGGGVNMVEGDSIFYFGEREGLIGDVVRAIVEDGQGSVWIGTSKGLAKFSEGKLMNFTEAQGLSSRDIFCLLLDSHKNLWVGTEGGGVNHIVNHKDGTASVRYYHQGNGLMGNHVRGMVEDFEKRVWVTTLGGINVLYKKPNKEEYQVTTFRSQIDCSKAVNFFRSSISIDKNNKLWLGGGNGLISLNLLGVETGVFKPTVSIEYLAVNGKYIDFHGGEESGLMQIEFDSVKAFTNIPNKMTLPHDRNHITFHFNSIQRGVEKVLFQYRIDGLDDEWSEATKTSYSDYRNIPPGQYLFRLRAIGDGGALSEEKTLLFTIEPPYWRTNLAYVVYALLLVIFYFVLLRWNTKRLKEKAVYLEQEVDKATSIILQQKAEVEEQRDIVSAKNREVLASISYAKRLQEALLPSIDLVKRILPSSFVLYQPKDIVAGDFYWVEQEGSDVYFAVGDCTGHGVPGAMVSVVCKNALNQVFWEMGERDPARILNSSRVKLLESFSKSKEEVQDGMDISLCCWNKNENKLLYAGANQPIWVVRNQELLEFKPNKFPVGRSERLESFNTQVIDLFAGDRVYLFSDGYADQMGGKKGKKLTKAGFKELLLSIQHIPMINQESYLSQFLREYRNLEEQLDDVCVFGVEVSS